MVSKITVQVTGYKFQGKQIQAESSKVKANTIPVLAFYL